MGNVLASMAASVASQERQSIGRRIRAGLDATREKGVVLGWPLRPTGELLVAVERDIDEGMPVAAARKYGCPDPRSVAPCWSKPASSAASGRHCVLVFPRDHYSLML